MSNPGSTGPDPATPRPHVYDPDAYWQAVSAEDERLQATLRAIRQDEANDYLTVREAADNRVAAMTAHLDACQAHGRTFLGYADREPYAVSDEALESAIREAIAGEADAIESDPVHRHAALDAIRSATTSHHRRG